MFNRIAIASLCFVSLACASCSKETTSSTNIRTAGIAALIDVYAAEDASATVHVELRVGGSSSNAYVDLDGADELRATVGDVTKTLRVRDTGVYEATFQDVEEEAEFSVVLDRAEDTSATSVGTLPPAFTLEAPTKESSRADDELLLKWAPESRGEMGFTLSGDCIFRFRNDVPDNGSYEIAPGTLDSTNDEEPEACDVEVDAQRTREGKADAEFDSDSYFKLHQRRRTSFVSNP